ncbi:L-2-hydroxyglutarate oxidase [uncultured Paraglaciecola sp.]|uniref:L-2-hydroxyglutarate oxidase n=1 Tax=uncultured Paraglaciecola sp. TaxID=1765024 RepID=UPI0025E49E39|nr:L-2-hydroxyglutarate oxidase [uncultured Paraglaciecola sp.]
MVDKVDVLIVGGGIVGLATALRIMQERPLTRLTLIEKELAVAQHQTGHNSGVIHSGLYYKPGSLKAINCRAGYRQMLDFCREQSIPHEICGKIVVATSPTELPGLEELYRRGVANGLTGLRFLQPAEIREIEPHCSGLRGLFVPQTGIVDYGAVARKYAELLAELGAEIVLGETVVDIQRQGEQVEVIGGSCTWVARVAVVCAGLQSDRLARKSEPDLPLRILPFRGEYFQFTASAPKLVNHLIYPVPDPAFPFLGVHFTRMIGGGVECGPNAVFAFGREAYKKTDFNLRDLSESLTWPGFRKVATKYFRTGLGEYHRSFSKQAFVKALQKLIPEIQVQHLEPGGAGVRAQACDRQGNLLNDFYIREDGNIIHVCNAPSPAATASLAIGKTISDNVLSLLN